MAKRSYDDMAASDLKYYLGSRGLGLHPVDVEHYLGKRVSVYSLKKVDLVKLHRLIDKKTKRGLGFENG